jgi:BirA family biotin operon repressor/biotin-[acetyl-CoA-carboxylase] ligase
MANMGDMGDTSEVEEWRLPDAHIGRRTLVYHRVDSTNNVAANLALDHSQDGLAVLAHEQTDGRGQHGRTWSTPPEAAVLLSVALFPPPALIRPVVLTAWAAVAVCQTVCEITEMKPRIKWPNDVLIGGKKLAGILIERRVATVAGIGLNVNQSEADFATLGLGEATSLAAISGRPHSWEATVRLLLAKLDDSYGALLKGDLAGLEADWKKLIALERKDVCVTSITGQEQDGRLVECRFEGVRLETHSGQVLDMKPESVRHIRERA